jgi:hypothetical protein
MALGGSAQDARIPAPRCYKGQNSPPSHHSILSKSIIFQRKLRDPMPPCHVDRLTGWRPDFGGRALTQKNNFFGWTF